MSEYSFTGNVWSAASLKILEFSPQCLRNLVESISKRMAEVISKRINPKMS
jgi:hypothetical protein